MVKPLWNSGFPESFWQALETGGIQMDLGGRYGPRLLQRIDASPCHAACPAGVNVKGYVGLIADGKFREAVELVRKDCPLPGICGRVCTHPCELNCRRSDLDDPLAIRLLKRFVADWELENPGPEPVRVAGSRPEKLAVIGAGPAGLAAAFDLANLGYGVTVYESEETAGGMLVQCIPSFRLPREVVASEVAHIESLGVEVKTGVRVGKDISLDELRDQGYAAIILALGAALGKKMNIPGERENTGVFDCLTFLRMASKGEAIPKGKSLIVVGGGMSAMDAARTAKRLGFEKVEVVYRRTKEEMPAVPEEVVEAENEGVTFTFLAGPLEVIGKKGKVTGLLCQRMELGEPDESGRRRPVPIKGDTFTVEADLIVPAISQEANLDLLPDNLPFKKSSWGTLEADSVSLMTEVEGVFAAGDLVLGPDTVIGAIAHGHRAAKAAHAWLEGRPLKDETLRPIEVGVQPPLPTERKRAIQPELPVEKRGGFDEVELGFAQDMAVREAERCLRCGPCDECQTCADECRYRIGLLSFMNSGHNVPLFIRIPENDEQFPLPLKPEPVALEWKTRREGKKVIERMGMKLSSLVCQVNEKLCRGCEDCLKGCDYEAILMEARGEGVQVARVLADRCKGCGNCVPLCPTQAMVPGYFRNDFVRHEIDALLKDSAEVKA